MSYRQYSELLADVPESDLDPAIFGGIGNLLVKLIKQTDPKLSEAAWGIAYGFCQLLRERMRAQVGKPKKAEAS